MKLRILIAGLMIAGTAAFAAESGAELFQKALTQERAAGNLEEAIKLYQRVATQFGSDRALAAKALVQEARCYEKLGQGKAVKLYEQVAHDYKDQGESAAAANARLVALRTGDKPTALPATMSQRKIEFTQAPEAGQYSLLQTDGQRWVYKDQTSGAIMVRDLSGANQRAVFKPKVSISYGLPTSRDFSMVGMYQSKPDGSRSYAVVKLDGTGYRDTGIANACRPEWSWDDRYLLLCDGAPSPTRKLLKYSLADGQVREIGTTSTADYMFSPDGRFIAYGGPGGLYIMSSEGGESQLIAKKGALMDWTRDGRYLAASADRDGSEALYLLPVKDGRANGEAIFVRYGSFAHGRTLASGALIYFSTPPTGDYATWVSSLDAAGHVGSWKALPLSGSSRSLPHIRWSPDGAQFVYATANSAAGQSSWVARTHNMATGEEHQIFQSTRPIYCVWSRQQPKLFCVEETSAVKTEVVSVSTETGRVEQLGSLTGSIQFYFMNEDDTAIYGRSSAPAALIRWDISTHQVTTVEQSPGLLSSPMGMMSPDARWISRQKNGRIEIRPFAGGDWKPAFADTRELAFTPDSTGLVYRGQDAAGKFGLYRMATAGVGQPERIGDVQNQNTAGMLYIGPDGRTLIDAVFSSAAYTSAELSVLENFEPKAQIAKK